MSMMRQSAHIFRRLIASPPANIEWPASRPTMDSIICFVANGLPQRMQSKGSASFRTLFWRASAPSNRRASSDNAPSGQVCTHSLHWTQLRSMNFRRGISGVSVRARVGQAPTHDRHSVHFALSRMTWPNGAPAKRGISSGFCDACFAKCSRENSSERRFSSGRLNTADSRTPSAGFRFQICSCSAA